MVAWIGVATIAALLAAILSKRISPLVALIAVPIISAFAAGFGGRTFEFAVQGLESVAPLVAILMDEDEGWRWTAAAALQSLGWQPTEDTQKATLFISQHKWDEAVTIGAAAVEPLIAVLKRESEKWREGAAKALGEIGDARAAEPVGAAFKNSNGWGESGVKIAAAKALVKIVDIGAVEPLISVLKGGDKNVSKKAAETLGKIGDARAIEPLVAALRYSDEERASAAEALVKIGEAAVEPLAAALKDSNASESVRACAAKALGQIGNPRAIEPLIEALNDSDWRWVRPSVVEALVKIGEAAVEPLVAVLRDSDVYLRASIVGVLQSLGWQPSNGSDRAIFAVARREFNEAAQMGEVAIEPLAAALKDSDYNVRIKVADALGKIGNARAIELLIASLKAIVRTEFEERASQKRR